MNTNETKESLPLNPHGQGEEEIVCGVPHMGGMLLFTSYARAFHVSPQRDGVILYHKFSFLEATEYKEIKALRVDERLVADFIEKHISPIADITTPKSEVYDEFTKWCTDIKQAPIARNSFWKFLRRLVPSYQETFIDDERFANITFIKTK